MGTEYALVHPETKTFYNLGIGPWYEWNDERKHSYDDGVGFPRSRDEVVALLQCYQESWSLGLQPQWENVVADEIGHSSQVIREHGAFTKVTRC